MVKINISKGFTNWQKLFNKNGDLIEREEYKKSGVYIIADSTKIKEGQFIIENKEFKWQEGIIYIGMTNNRHLIQRIKELKRSIENKKGHSGGKTMFKKGIEKNNLYISIITFGEDLKNSPQDIRIKGDIARFEYECFALYEENLKSEGLPLCNKKT